MDDNTTTDVGEQTNIPPTAEATETQDTPVVEKAESQAPAVEYREGKVFIDGKRVYTRDETNNIANNAVNTFLKEEGIDSRDKAKEMFSTLKSINNETADGDVALKIKQMASVIKDKDQTAEQLQQELKELKQQIVIDRHMSKLNEAMPTGFDSDQKQSVIDIMKARNMFEIQENDFAIKNNGDYLTSDGETPDYQAAVDIVVSQVLKMPISKKGVNVPAMEVEHSETKSNKPVDENRRKSDRAYNNALVSLMKKNGGSMSGITHNDVVQQLKSSTYRPTDSLKGYSALR